MLAPSRGGSKYFLLAPTLLQDLFARLQSGGGAGRGRVKEQLSLGWEPVAFGSGRVDHLTHGSWSTGDCFQRQLRLGN